VDVEIAERPTFVSWRKDGGVGDSNLHTFGGGLVKMVRDPGMFPPPYTADVHSSEVDNYRAAGWEVKPWR
jgi:hypothetical protein